jgi:NO-binding membrane sensor protein with MHYT domain
MNTTIHQEVVVETRANGLLIALSYVISVLGVFTCFQIITEVKFVTHKLIKSLLVLCAAVSLSIGYEIACYTHFLFIRGIFPMHFIGTICFSHATMQNGELTISYELVSLIFSAFAPLVLTCIGFIITTIQLFIPTFRTCFIEKCRLALCGKQDQQQQIEHLAFSKWIIGALLGDERRPHMIQVLLGGLFSSLGVLMMHYLGMHSTFINYTVRSYNAGLVTLSVLLAVVACCLAMWLAFNLDNLWLHFISAIFAGILICGVHYSGMMAATYSYIPTENTATIGNITLSNYEVTLVIALLTLTSCFILLLISSYARKQRELLTRANQQLERELSLIESKNQLSKIANDIHDTHTLAKIIANSITECVLLVNSNGRIIHVNSNFKHVFGCEFEMLAETLLFNFIAMNETETLELLDCSSTTEEFQAHLVNESFGRKVQIRLVKTVESYNFETLIVLRIYANMNIQKPRVDNVVGANACKIDNLLNNSNTRDLFVAFCTQKLCYESILFIIQVKEYKATQLIEDRVQKQAKIYNEFISNGAPYALNINSSTIELEHAKLTKCSGELYLFDHLEQLMKQLVFDNVYNEFIKSIE